MSTQIAVRLPDETVAFIDELVANGSAGSRAEVVSRALRREQRRFLASRDAAIIALHPNDDDFDQLAEFAARLALDVD
jgi:Arc/MetJ-type ribon-helix-helix transcriptional regulator